MEQGISNFGELFEPHQAIEPILAQPVRDSLLEWLVEIWNEEELRAWDVKVRNSALFYGPPGSGKTTLAHHLAARLGLSMLAVRPNMIIDKWVGSSGRNIGDLFRYVASANPPIMLFFDEFDALAIQRKKSFHDAEDERNAYVNTLLQCIERCDSFIIASTNFPDRIDQAIWRRFKIHVEIDLPGQFERQLILERYLAPLGLPEDSLSALAEAFSTASPDLMQKFCVALKRNIILTPKLRWKPDRESTIDRIISSLKPHPDLGKPRLWSHGSDDIAIKGMPWPIPKAADLNREIEVDRESRADASVVNLHDKSRGIRK